MLESVTDIFPDKYSRESLLYPHETPIERFTNLERLLEKDVSRVPEILVSREDSNSGLAGGGNKIRKLEFVMFEAVSQNATVLVTTGGQQSNHMRQVVAAAAKLAKTHLVPRQALRHDTADSRLYNKIGNVQLTNLMSAERHPTCKSAGEIEDAIEAVMAILRAQGEVPYWIPSGASTHELGGLGYARFALELVEQFYSRDEYPDVIFVACNSGSTLAGLVAGFKLVERYCEDTGTPWRSPWLVGVDTYSGKPPGGLYKHVLDIAQNTASLIWVKDPGSTPEYWGFEIDERFRGDAYGCLDDNVNEAIKTVATTEGVLLDPVYTGKAFAALLHSARHGEYKDKNRDKDGQAKWLFIHTGGTAVLGAYPELQ